jgi:hypothetical protein
MATKTYWEVAQTAVFRAAREVRAVAQSVLDDMQNDAELTSELTLAWAKDRARDYALQANELEQTGYEYGTPDARTERAMRKSRQSYSDAITAYEKRIASAQERTKTPA